MNAGASVNNWVLTRIWLALLLLLTVAPALQSEEIYRSKQDGRTVYSNTPISGGKVVGQSESPPPERAAKKPGDSPQQGDNPSERRRAKERSIDEAFQNMQDAQARLQEAIDALAAAKKPGPDDYEYTVTPFGPGSKLKDSYHSRVQSLQSQAAVAQQRYDDAVQRWRDVAQ